MGAGLRHRWVPRRISAAVAILMVSSLAAGQPQSVSAAASVCAASTFAGGFFDAGAVVNGTLLMWGRNLDGQLGQGFKNNFSGTPTPVDSTTGLSNVTGFWPSFSDTFATDGSGRLWSWGGDDSSNERGSSGAVSPALVPGPSNVISVSPNGGATIALQADGTMWGWGYPSVLGLPGNFPVNPTVIPGVPGTVKLGSGGSYTLALTSNGTVYGIGGSNVGQLGLGSGTFVAHSFQLIPGLTGIMDVAGSQSAGTEFSLASDSTGHVWGFGSNFYGQMGTPPSGPQFTPQLIPGIDSVVQVAAGDGNALVLRQDGTVWAWGENLAGELGNGSTTSSHTPAPVTFPAGVQIVRIAAGAFDSMALDSTGHLWTWGYNGDGEVGNGIVLGAPVVLPQMLNIGAVVPGCTPQPPKNYLPSVNGYAFQNPGGAEVTVPDYDHMVSFYPDSRFEIEYPVFNTPTYLAKWFHKNLWVSTYTAGLCYGIVTSSQFLYSHFPDKSTVALYPDFPGGPNSFPGGLGASPSPADTTIEQFIDRYHSRQLAAAGALASIGTWRDTQLHGNTAAFAQIEADVASGKTEWVGLGPSDAVLTEGPDPRANAKRWWFLYNASHAVLAYRADKAAGRIYVYDPNAVSNADKTFIELKDSSINPGGGMVLVHNGDDSIQANLSYGGGVTRDGVDLGLPGEWSLMPLPEASFTEQGSVPLESNRKWVLDAAGPIAVIGGATIPTFLGVPIFLMSGSASAPSESEFLPAGTGLNEVITAARPGASTSQQSASHVVDVIQTEAAAAGTTHQVSISQDASVVDLSSASSAQQYTVALAADFLPSYGRSMTVTAATLSLGATLELSVDQAYSSLNLSASSMSAQQASLLLEQAGQGAGSANVTVTVPGGGGRGVVFVGDWTGLGQSLIFESIKQSDGTVVGLLLQDNAAQRQQLIASLLQSVQSDISQVSDPGIQKSLQAKLNGAEKQVSAGDPRTAANVLVALGSEVTDQTGVTIPPDLATTFHTSLLELIGLLRASPTA